MLGRLATYVIPSAAVAAAAFFLLGPGVRRAALGVRVRGVPAEGGEVLAWRIEGIRRLQSVDEAAPIVDLTVEAWSGGAELPPWHGATGPDGIGEAVLRSPRPLKNPVDLRVTRGAAVLAKGRVALRATPPSFFQLASVRGTATGDLRIRVDVLRGVLAAPFADPVRISVETADGAPVASGVPLTIEAPGAEITPDRAVTDGRGAATVSVKPLAHDVELTVTVTDERRRAGRWEGHLPIRPGAIWLDPARFAGERKLSLLSPAPRDRAYVSVIGERGRVFGAAVPLAANGSGFFAGEIALDPSTSDRLLYAVVAGDPLEQGSGTSAWPLVPPEGAAAMRTVELLVDGVPGAEGREAERAAAARRIGVMVLVLAAVLEVMLLLVQSREAQRRLEQHLTRAAELVAAASAGIEPTMSAEDKAALMGSARENPRVRTLAFAALVALAFALVAAFVSIR